MKPKPTEPGATKAMSVAVPCTHEDQTDAGVQPQTQGCAECLARGEAWVHLRVCLTCGHVGCCDSSRGQHAQEHHRVTGHPIVRSLEAGEGWRWCYVDETFLV